MADGEPSSGLTPEAVRAVQFREKLRGYHPDDVDQFVADVAEAMDDARARIATLEAQVAELESRTPEPPDIDESLKRTLVLAQRTADLAIQEARDDAGRLLAEARSEHEKAMAEAVALRTRLHDEAEEEVRPTRERLFAERAALQADVDAITAYLERERERLRIYFTDQLRRVDDGYPGLAPPPEMTGPSAPAPADPVPVGPTEDDAPESGGTADAGAPEGADDGDAFLAELRRAVNDEAPLGPRDEESAGTPPAQDDDFDLFAPDEDDGGRFGGLRRRRR